MDSVRIQLKDRKEKYAALLEDIKDFKAKSKELEELKATLMEEFKKMFPEFEEKKPENDGKIVAPIVVDSVDPIIDYTKDAS